MANFNHNGYIVFCLSGYFNNCKLFFPFYKRIKIIRLIEAYGGILEEAGDSQIIYKTMYLNFGRWIPAKQKFLLTKLKIENTKRENPICLRSIKVSDNRSHFIQVNGQSCLMYNE